MAEVSLLHLCERDRDRLGESEEEFWALLEALANADRLHYAPGKIQL